MKKDTFASLGNLLHGVQQETTLFNKVPQKVIDSAQAATYYNNYYATRIANSTTYTNRSVYFEFQALQNYFNRVTQFCEAKNIEITRFSFLLGATKNNERTIVIAPVTYDEQLDLHRAFSFDNDTITYLHRFAGENYSTEKELDQLQSLDQSLLFCDSKEISSADTITLYNNYFDSVTKPFASILKKDTRFVYYTKGEFENYLAYLETQAAENNIDLNGLQVVFGAHNNQKSEGIYANHLTLFFVPSQGKDKRIAFSSFDTSNEQVIDLSQDLITINPSKLIGTTKSTLFNRGHAGPPPHAWD